MAPLLGFQGSHGHGSGTCLGLMATNKATGMDKDSAIFNVGSEDLVELGISQTPPRLWQSFPVLETGKALCTGLDSPFRPGFFFFWIKHIQNFLVVFQAGSVLDIVQMFFPRNARAG